MIFPQLSDEEALSIARISAYRIARHQGRNDDELTDAYTLDPMMVILAHASQFLLSAKEKIGNAEDAIELAFSMVKLLIAYHVKQKTNYIPDDIEFERLAILELNKTVELLKFAENISEYSNYDVAEKRAASELHVPFKVALRLGEIGALRDDHEPTIGRKKIFESMRKEQRLNLSFKGTQGSEPVKERNRSNPFLWISIVLVIGLVFYSNLENFLPSSIENQENALTVSGGAMSNPDSASANSQNEVLSFPDLSFDVPLEGEGQILNLPQLRWCVREDIRLDFLMNRELSNSQLSEVNSMIDFRNSRCGNFQYRNDDYQRAQSEVEIFRSQIENDVVLNF